MFPDEEPTLESHLDLAFQNRTTCTESNETYERKPPFAAIDMFTKDDPTPILVLEDGNLQGMVTQENLSEFIMLEHARRQGRKSYGYTA